MRVENIRKLLTINCDMQGQGALLQNNDILIELKRFKFTINSLMLAMFY